MHWLVLASVVGALAPVAAWAETSAATTSPEEKRIEERKKLEEEIAKELGAPAARSSAPAAAPAAQPAMVAESARGSQGQGQVGGNPLGRLMLIPDISAIGSGALVWNSLDVEAVSPRGDPFAPAHEVKPIFQELELGLQAVIDPYARADIFLSFSPGGAAVEEAYLTTLALPHGFQLKAGQLYAPFGRLNQQHPHTWDFVDRPLALARLLAVDGLGGPGFDVSWLAPLPWFAEAHLAYQALTPAFGGAAHEAGVARVVQFFDVGEGSTVGMGVSAAHMSASGVDSSRDILGGDVMVKFRPPSTRSYLTLQGEVVARRLGAGDLQSGPGGGEEQAGTAWGGYVQALFRHGAYLAYGARYERAPGVEGGPENRVSALATWLPSEFQRIRLQVAYDRLPGGADGLEALLHLEFIIGSHGAHPF